MIFALKSDIENEQACGVIKSQVCLYLSVYQNNLKPVLLCLTGIPCLICASGLGINYI